MSAFLEIASFFVNHGTWVAAGSALAIGVAMLAPLARARPTKRGFTLPTSSPATATYLQANAQPGPKADPMELLRSYARSRGSHVVVLGSRFDEQDTAPTDSTAKQLRIETLLHSYRDIPKDKPIDLVLTRSLPWSVGDTRRVARVLDAHPSKVTAIIPFQILGPLGLLAFAADEIIMSEHAAIVPDVMLTGAHLAALAKKKRSLMSPEALLELFKREQGVRETEWLAGLLLKSRGVRRWRRLARSISRGAFNGITPLRMEDLKAWGLQVTSGGFVETLALSDVAVQVLASKDNVPGPALKVAPTCVRTCPIGEVRDAMVALEQQRGSRVISIIHAGNMTEDGLDTGTTAEALKAIRSVPAGTDIDIILHTPGGSALGASQIIRALKAHKGRKTFFVPYDAFSAGTMLALTGNEIFMSDLASLGPIDVQFGHEPAAAFESLLHHKRPKDIEDDFLVTAMRARQTIRRCHENAKAAMKGSYSRFRAERIARTLNTGYLSHDFPLMYQEARMIGMHVRLGVPHEVFTIVNSFLERDDRFCSVIHCPD
jgi:hypothetical protein